MHFTIVHAGRGADHPGLVAVAARLARCCVYPLAAAVAQGSSTGQCTTGWNAGAGAPGATHPVQVVRGWDQDGSGPQPPLVVVGAPITPSGGPGGLPVNLATFDLATSAWSPIALVGGGSINHLKAVATMPNGDLVVGGLFATVGGVAANSVAQWNGTNWSPLGSGVEWFGQPGLVHAVATLPNGDLVVAGDFTTAGGIPAASIARWDGATWWPLGSGTDNQVQCLTVLPNGDLVAGGRFFAAGGVPSGRIARWDGATWWPLGTGVYALVAPRVLSLTTLPNGDVVAGGWFDSAGGVVVNGIARWDGVAWSALGTGVSTQPTFVTALTALPNGELVAGGTFHSTTGGVANGIARWNGSNWSPLGLGLSIAGGPSAADCVATLPSGELIVGGNFNTAGGLPAQNLSIWTTTCPAGAGVFGAGCVGGGGPNVLAPETLPWVGATYRALATGLTANTVALEVYGFSSVAIPLAAILPQGLPGCSLFAAPDLLLLHVAPAGSVTTALVIPANVALAGVLLHQQVVPLELDLLGNLTALTSTNALALTIGSY